LVWDSNNLIKGLYIQNFNVDLVNKVPFNISSTITSHKSFPRLSLSESGSGMVIWHDSREIEIGGKTRIFAKKIADYTPQESPDIKVSTTGLDAFDENLPDISLNNSGNGIAIWNDNVFLSEKIIARHIINFQPFINNLDRP
jgi:hypothetical protein